MALPKNLGILTLRYFLYNNLESLLQKEENICKYKYRETINKYITIQISTPIFYPYLSSGELISDGLDGVEPGYEPKETDIAVKTL